MRLKLEELSVEQKLGMLLCARRCYVPEDLEVTLELIRNHAVGCVQVPTNEKTPAIMKAIREAADYPLLLIADMEQGYPRADLPKLPAMSLAACDNVEYYRAFARGIVATAKADGFTGTWCPVLDVLRRDGPCRVSRHFGDTPEKVLRAAEEISRVFRESGFISAGKHYPGGSDNDLDTHMAEGISDVSEAELTEFDIAPYVGLMKKGLLPAIMAHHCVYRKIDPQYPATLSPKVIGIIRRLGFDGAIFTDSLAMMGILQKYGEENVMGMCIAAGCDIVLPNYRTSTRDCYEMLLKNYRDGAFSEERLNDAVRHVLALQAFVEETADRTASFTEHDRECLENIAKDCITAITDKGLDASLGDVNKKRLFIVVTEQGFHANAPEAEITTDRWYYPENIGAKIKQEFPNAEVAFLPELASAKDNDRVLTAATRHDEVIFVTFCVTLPYLGTDCLTRRTEALINALNLSDKISAVLHFGNPYAMKPIHHVPRRIFGYTAATSQKYAIEVLAGKLPPKGKLPFDIEFD